MTSALRGITAAEVNRFIVAITCILAVPAAAEAQSATFRNVVGIGAGYSNVTKTATGSTFADLHLHGRASREVSRFIALGFEVGLFALNDDHPLPSDVSVDARNFAVTSRTPRVFRTSSFIVSTRIGGRSPFFVRPGVGLGTNSFAVYGPGYSPPAPSFTWAEKSSEAGLAASLASGYDLRFTPRFQVTVEGLVVWSHGEDSSSPRRILGLQVVPGFRF